MKKSGTTHNRKEIRRKAASAEPHPGKRVPSGAGRAPDGAAILPKVELWPIGSIKPYERNARTISESAVETVASSIREFGWRQPIVVDKESVIMVGHARFLAAQKLGLTHVPVHVADNLAPAQVKAYRLMDNRSHDASGWDVQKLSEELNELKGIDFALGLTGFEQFELQTLLTESAEKPHFYQTESIAIDQLQPHPRNYRSHPDDQLDHIIQSVKEHGFYRNIVVAKDSTILAGHGLVAACKKMGHTHIQVVRLDTLPDSIEALKIMAGDNDIQNRGVVNDRMLTEMLKEIRDKDSLLGSGYDDMMLANLLYVTRPASEIKDSDRTAEWVGMPEYDNGEQALRIAISFSSQADRVRFVEHTGIKIQRTGEQVRMWTTWWPPRENDDRSSLKFESAS